jgi:FKBP-type peptidyl-prolyl cis-trans isomerase
LRTRQGLDRAFCLALLTIGVACSSAVAVADDPAPNAAPPRPPAVSAAVASYDVGLMLGSELEHNGLRAVVSLDDLIRGLKDSVGGRALTAEERDVAVQFSRAARNALADRNRAAAREFLDRNAKEPGVITLPSGLQYRELAPGQPAGKAPGPTDDVTVRYRASLGDGTEFDRSDAHDRPATFRVNGVLKAWQEALLAMKPGAKWQLFVPPELGYGANTPPAVPPGSLVVYELELLHVAPAKTPPIERRPAAAQQPAAPSAAPH